MREREDGCIVRLFVWVFSGNPPMLFKSCGGLLQVGTHGFGRDDPAKRTHRFYFKVADFWKLSWNIITLFSHTSEIASFNCRLYTVRSSELLLLPSTSPASCLETILEMVSFIQCIWNLPSRFWSVNSERLFGLEIRPSFAPYSLNYHYPTRRSLVKR